MSAYLVGNLIGRFITSYIVVWLLCWLFAKFNWREAFKRSRGWKGIVGVFCVFSLGLIGAIVKQGSIVS